MSAALMINENTKFLGTMETETYESPAQCICECWTINE